MRRRYLYGRVFGASASLLLSVKRLPCAWSKGSLIGDSSSYRSLVYHCLVVPSTRMRPFNLKDEQA
jgi:hypothetical protein